MSQVDIRIAILDHDGIYWGLKKASLPEDLADGAVVFCAPALLEAQEENGEPVSPELILPEGAVYAGQDCDLTPGAYRWNAKERRFDALPMAQRKVAQLAPSLERALLDYLLPRLEELPPATRAWVEWMQKTNDEQEKGRK